MAGSQLKRLKASLRDQGVIGPTQSKKQKRSQMREGNGPKRLEKKAAIDGIREQFNPFDLKHNVRGPKFDVTTNRRGTGKTLEKIHGRPSEARTADEMQRRQTILQEMQRKSKIGAIIDRRFGENDPSMTPEEKMLERFAREKQRSHHKNAMFDLEDDEAVEGLTHMGQSLSFNGPDLVDDYDEEDLNTVLDGEENDEGHKAYLKRARMTGEGDQEEEEVDEQPGRKKTKAEVMKEVIEKSKFYKYERQQAKDADEDLREELDRELPNIHSLLHQNKSKDPRSTPLVHSTVAAEETEKERFDRDYDLRVRQMAQDRRAQPAERTKTLEEIAEENSKRLQALEEERLRRMNGQVESEDEEESHDEDMGGNEQPNRPIRFEEDDEDDGFGLGPGIKTRPTATELGLDDEDDFIIEDDLIDSDPETSLAASDESGDEASEADLDVSEEPEEDEFTKNPLTDVEAQNPVFTSKSNGSAGSTGKNSDHDGLPYTFPCPANHQELLRIVEDMPVEKLAVVIQRVRALYHPKLDSSNQGKMAAFSTALVHHLPYLASLHTLPPFSVLESLIRHIHSLAKTFPLEISVEFRSHIEELGRTRPLSPNLGDLVMLTAVGTIFPTSDHFHQVVTPAMLSIARFLGQHVPQSLSDYSKGAYLSILALQYQKTAKRYVPELMNWNLNTLWSLAPERPQESLGFFPVHQAPVGTRIRGAAPLAVRKLSCLDCVSGTSEADVAATKIAIVATTVNILETGAELWDGKMSFLEIYQPASRVLAHLMTEPCSSQMPEALVERIIQTRAKIERRLKLAQLDRRSLELHHHRPRPVKSNVPKFEDSFDPIKHYDPDRERADLAKLRKEHKRERKGAMRELRKDANFTAREKLRLKKAKDEAYEKKHRRLVAEIQGEEGREANAYEREKAQRKSASKRR